MPCNTQDAENDKNIKWSPALLLCDKVKEGHSFTSMRVYGVHHLLAHAHAYAVDGKYS